MTQLAAPSVAGRARAALPRAVLESSCVPSCPASGRAPSLCRLRLRSLSRVPPRPRRRKPRAADTGLRARPRARAAGRARPRAAGHAGGRAPRAHRRGRHDPRPRSAESASSVSLDQAELAHRPHEQPSICSVRSPRPVRRAARRRRQGRLSGSSAASTPTTAPTSRSSSTASRSTSPATATAKGTPTATWRFPETVASIEVHKGPYAARFGDFYTAGAVETTTIDRAPGGAVIAATSGVGLDGPERLARPSGPRWSEWSAPSSPAAAR